MLGRVRREDFLKLRQDGDFQNRTSFLLLYAKETVAHVLAPHVDDITPALGREEEEPKGQPGAGIERKLFLKLPDRVFRPRHKTFTWLGFDARHPESWVVGSQMVRNADLDHSAQGIDKMPRRMRRSGLFRDHRLDMFPLQAGERFIAMSLAEAFEDSPADALGAGTKVAKRD